MKLAQKFALVAAASLSTGCLASFGQAERYQVWGYMSSAMNEVTTPSFEGSKAIKRVDLEDHTTLYTFDVAKSELCINTYKRDDIKGKPQRQKCQPTSNYFEPHLEGIISEACDNALKDAVNARQVLDFCAKDHYGQQIVKPELTYEGSKAIKRFNTQGKASIFTFDVAKGEVCMDAYSGAEVTGTPEESKCWPTSFYKEPQLREMTYEICHVAQKDPVGAKQVLDFCAQDRFGREIIKPKP